MSKKIETDKETPSPKIQTPNLSAEALVKVDLKSHVSLINDTFFNELYQKIWRKLIPPGLSEAECGLILDACNLQKGDRLLDLMCGYGRHTLPLARTGINITAIDNAAAYINEIKSTIATEQLPAEAIHATAIDADFLHQYKAVICMGNSFAFFDSESTRKLLRKIADHLVPGGMLIINSWMIAEIAIRHFKEREWINVDGFKYIMHYHFHFCPHRIESEHTIVAPDNTVETINGVDYILTLSELEKLFNEAGLYTKAVFSTPKKRPFKMGDNTVYLIIEKVLNNA